MAPKIILIKNLASLLDVEGGGLILEVHQSPKSSAKKRPFARPWSAFEARTIFQMKPLLLCNVTTAAGRHVIKAAKWRGQAGPANEIQAIVAIIVS